MSNQFVELHTNINQTLISLKGDWTLSTVTIIEKELNLIESSIEYKSSIVWDLSSLCDFDSSGVLLFIDYQKKIEHGAIPQIIGAKSNHLEIYQLLTQESYIEKMHRVKRPWIESVGKSAVEFFEAFNGYLIFFGTLFYLGVLSLLQPHKIRWKETVYHIYQSGVKALVIVGMTSFLVGMVIAYQGAVQLAKFGADIFIVDTLSISMTREIGPMVTAIVIAGRSGSSYTAEIGAMKITEEIAAMKTMGFDPYRFLVLPRIIALMIALPLLIFFADIVGILGGLVAASTQLDISATQFIDRLYEVLSVEHYLLGMLKGPVFAFLIASVGCYRGFQVAGNTESIGLQTTASVVNGIFLIIAFDALFSVIYTEMGL